jgi:hypothetical protein
VVDFGEDFDGPAVEFSALSFAGAEEFWEVIEVARSEFEGDSEVLGELSGVALAPSGEDDAIDMWRNVESALEEGGMEESGDLDSGDGDFEMEAGFFGDGWQDITEGGFSQPAGDEEAVCEVRVIEQPRH